jgi:hypothetical protein
MRKFMPNPRSQALIAGVMSATALALPAHAQGNAIPDFSGLWGRDSLNLESPLSGPGPVVNMSHQADGTMDMNKLVGDYTNPILKPEAAAILKRRGELSLMGQSVPNAHEQCRPEPPPFIFAVQFAFEMLQQKDEVTILYSHDNKVRHVRMNVPHPAHVTPSGQGDSVGRYEGDTLVIDTVGIKASPISTLDWYGTPHSDALHVVERWTRPDADHIHVETLIEDPKFYTRPFTYARTWIAGNPDDQLNEYSCSENNVDKDHLGFGPGPIRKDGTRGYENPAPLPPPIPKAK